MPSHRKTSRKPANADTAAEPADRFRPWLLAGMAALLVARPLFPSESAATWGDGLPVVMLWLALGAIWLVGSLGRKRFILRFGPVDAIVLVLVAWQCIAAVHAVRYGSPRPALNMLWEWVGLGMVFFLARQLIHDAREARSVVAAMIALMAAISVYGLYQCAIEMPAEQRRFAADPEAMLREAGLNYPPGTPDRDLFEKRLANREPLATFALTNSLAAALSPWLVVGLGIAATTRKPTMGTSGQERRQWIAWSICLVPIAVCLLLTKSRSGYVAAAVGIIWLAQRSRHTPCAVRPEKKRGWGRRADGTRSVPATLACTAALIGLVAATVSITALVKPKAVTSFAFRVQYWQATLHMIADRPWLGCGPGNFQDVYTQYKLPEASEEVADPHDFLLEVWATAGTPAMLALLGVLGLFWANCRVGFSPPLQEGGLKPTPLHDWKFVLAGLMGGFLLSIPLGQISAAPPSNMAVLIGLPVAVVCMALLVPWIRSGSFPPDDHGYMVPAGLGVAVLLVDLLTTGGIGMPAVAQSLWLLLALGLDGAWPRHPQAGHEYMVPDMVPARPRAVAMVLLAIVLGLSVACHQTSYARVLPCQGFLRLARREYLDGQQQSALEAAQKAVDADPRSSDAHAFLAEIHLDAWLASPDPADYEAFEAHDALARQMAPQSASIWRASADHYRRAFAKTDARGQHVQPRAVEQAIEIAQRTTNELYPGSGSDRAALAMIYHQAGDEVAYRREAKAALELDRRMTHEDKRLPESLRQRLEAAAEGSP